METLVGRKLPRNSLRFRLLWIGALLGLWVLSAIVFTRYTHKTVFRADMTGVVAYPNSDAGSSFMNAMAILSGDGWVEWRNPFARWTVYKPGWCLILAALAEACDRVPARMQRVITISLAFAGPALFLLLMSWVRGRAGFFVGLAAALVFVFYPQGPSWWFQNTMMTEGPTLLLSIALCGLGMAFCGRRDWDWREGFCWGALAAGLGMIRSQGRLAFAVVFALVFLASLRDFRRRLPFLTLTLVGYLFIAGPYCLKTSVHLGHPFFGTSHGDLVAVVHYSKVGARFGGEQLGPELKDDEFGRIRAFGKRANQAALYNLKTNPDLFRLGGRWINEYLFSGLSKFLHARVGDPRFFVPVWLLAFLGSLYLLLRRGVTALLPWGFLVGYFSPHFVFSYYELSPQNEDPRFGAPVSWIGLAYFATGAFAFFRLLCSRRERGFVRRRLRRSRLMASLASLWPLRRASAGPSCFRKARWPGRLAIAAMLVWAPLSAAALLAYDKRPYAPIDAARLLRNPKTQAALGGAHMDAQPSEFVRKVNNALAGKPDADVWVGVGFLPAAVHPTDPPFYSPHLSRGVSQQSRVFTVLPLARPWKLGGFRFTSALFWGTMPEGFRNGDEVVVVTTWNQIDNQNEQVVIPTKWADEK